MITLYTLPEAFGLRNVSPFCLKVEMALTYLKLDFDIALEADPRKAPKGKLPYMVIDGLTIADSELIFEHLDKITDGGLYGKLNAQEWAQGMAFSRLADDHLYWIMVASRWLDDDWFGNIREGFFGNLPPIIKPLVANIARKQVRQTYNLHGLGRHNKDEQHAFAIRDLKAIDAVVGENQYIVGKRLTVFDFNIASLLAGALDNKPQTWLGKLAEDFPNLVDYAERIQREVNVYGRPV